MIRLDAVWLALDPMDMRAGTVLHANEMPVAMRKPGQSKTQ